MKYRNNLLALSACMFLACLFVQCDKDCSGSYTIEGVIWNGTKNQPRSNILIRAGAGGQSGLFSSSVPSKDFEQVRTNSDGRFKINYDCVNEEDWKVSIHCSQVPGGTIDGGLPLNQNINKTYNIPDSVTIYVYVRPGSPLAAGDTAYFYMPGASEFIEGTGSVFYFYSIRENSPVKEGLFKIIRLPYRGIGYPIDNVLNFKVAIGYSNYIVKMRTTPEYNLPLNALEPDINTITITY